MDVPEILHSVQDDILIPTELQTGSSFQVFHFNKSEVLEEMKVIFCFYIREGEK